MRNKLILAVALTLILTVAWAGQTVSANPIATFVVTADNLQGWGTFTVDGGFFKSPKVRADRPRAKAA